MNDLPQALESGGRARLPVLALALAGVLPALALLGLWLGLVETKLFQAILLAVLAGLGALGAYVVLSAPANRARQGEPRGLLALARHQAKLAEGLALTSPDGSVVYSNPAFWLLLDQAELSPGNFLPAEAIGKLPGAREAAYRLAKAAVSGQDWEEVVEQPQGPGGQGSSRWLRISLDCQSFDGEAMDRKASGCPSVGHEPPVHAWRICDVTSERSRQSDALIKLRRGLAALDLLPAGLLVASPEGRIAYMNATLASWLGADVSAKDAGALTLKRVFKSGRWPDDVVRLPASADGEAQAIDVELLRQDGQALPARLLARALPGSDGFSVGLLMGARPAGRGADGPQGDESRFTKLFQAAPVAMASVDGQGRIGGANPAFTRMFSTGPHGPAVIGRSFLEQLHIESQVAVRAALQTAARGEQPAQPIEIAFGTGARRAGQLFLSPNLAPGAEGDGVVLHALETTERKELEAQFAQSQKMQAIGQLAGGIAHDINNVLTVIIGFSDLLLANSAGDPAFHDLNEIKANANRAANLVRQLLAFSRRQTLRPDILSLNETISDLTVFLKRSLGEKVKLERDYGRDLWLVKADQTELGRVLVNLAVNAVDAMPNGGTLTIRTVNVPRDEAAKLMLTGLAPADYVLCQVADTGHGMTAEVLEKIFEPFFTTKEVGKGTGLGLSTVYGIVKQTGGYIYCDSALGVGTSFRIFLPRHAAGSVNIDREAKSEPKAKPRDLTGTGTVLLVEDEESVRRFAARALRRQGYAVLEAGNGLEALDVKAAHNGTVDLVVSDIVMPEMDGPTLLKELRKTNPDLKIIFMSGYADDALSSLDGGEEFAFLSKPFQLTDLVSAVKELMSQ